MEGVLDPRWGRADRVAVATVSRDGIGAWQEFDVGWDSLHDAGTEGSHHARVARFLREHRVETVAAHHMGAGMKHMLEKMGLTVLLGRGGQRERGRGESARRRAGHREPLDAALTAAAGPASTAQRRLRSVARSLRGSRAAPSQPADGV